MAGILEVCVDSLASAQAAIAGGADRLELCSALAVGGLTPYAELLQQIRAQSRIKIRCLIRPRAGDFLYTKDEILLMAAQIGNLKRLGADGFVIGCLTADGELDTAAMQPLLKAAEGTGLTLHRCKVSPVPSAAFSNGCIAAVSNSPSAVKQPMTKPSAPKRLRFPICAAIRRISSFV